MTKEKPTGPPPVPTADIIEAMGDGLIVTDLDGNIISVNRAMGGWLAEAGADAAELIGKSALDLPVNRPEDMEKYLELIKETIEKGRAGPLELPNTLGHWVSFTTSLVKDERGNPTALIAVIRDITELKRAEEERARAATIRERAAIVDAMADPLVMLNPDLEIVVINPAAEKMFGRKAEEVMGKDWNAEPWFEPKDMEKLMKAIQEFMETGESKWVETVAFTKDGKKIPIIATESILKDTEGNLRYLIATIRDITELKRTEEELKEELEELEDFHDVVVGRELKMIKMKEEIEELKAKLKESD